MVQTTFSVGNGGSLTTVLQDISGGADAAANTAYTITLTAAVSLLSPPVPSASVNLKPGSSVTFVGPYPFIIDSFAVSGTVITDVNFTGTITLDNGVLQNVAIATNSGGTVVAGLYTDAVLGTVGDAGDTAINSGTIQYGGPYAAIEFGSGTVQNGWNGPAAALISGAAGGVLLQSAGLVQNGGTITSSGGATAAVFLGSGTVDNGQLGATAATISGGFNGVEITGAGFVTNDGTIIGVAADAVYLGSGAVTNGEAGDVTALIDGGPAGNGVWIAAGAGTVVNYGSILGGGASGALLAFGGTLTNGTAIDTGALVSGAVDGVVFGRAGTLTNYGTIEGNGSDATNAVIGAFLEAGGTIANLGPAATISGLEWGAIVEGASGAVTNAGTILALAAAGIGVDLVAGGTVVNGTVAGSAAAISGSYDGVRISAGAAGAGAVVVNDGTITGTVGVDFQSGPTAAAGTLTNAGLIVSTGGSTGYAVVFGTGNQRLVLQSTGAFVGRVLGNISKGSSTVLELAGGTQGTLSGFANDGGILTDSAGSFAFDAIGTIVLDAGATWVLDGPGTLDTVRNAGAISVTGGPVTLTGSLSNSGSIGIGSSTLVATTGLVADQGAISVGAGGLLKALGGGIAAAGTAAIQVGGGAAASLVVTGAAATVDSNGNRIAVGSSGQGSLLVSQGGTVLAGTPFSNDVAIALGGSAGATGGLTVTDLGSQLHASGQLSVGLGGYGSLLIENQATVSTGNDSADTAQGFEIAQLAGASGSATVTGSKSLLANVGRFIVGDAGLGSLSIQAGATVTTTGPLGAVIANTGSASGSSVTVSGAGAVLQVGGTLVVGNGGFGSLALSQAGNVAAGALDLGAASGGDGVVSVVGTATALSLTGSLTVGDQSTGELTILGGASVTAASGTVGGVGAGSPSSVDIEGAGSHLKLTGTLAIGTAGAAVFTLGQSTELTLGGAVVTGVNGIFNQSGTVDPPNIVNDGVTNLGNGASSQADVSIDNSGLYTLANGTATLYTPLVTFDADPTTNAGSTNGGWQIGNAGTLVFNADVVDSSQVVEFTKLNGELVIGQHPDSDLAGTITGTVSPGAANVLGGWAAPIQNYKAGDKITFTGLSFLSDTVSGNAVTLWSGAGGTGQTLGVLDFITLTGAADKTGAGLAAAQIATLACYAAGTRIATAAGPRAVETLAVGEAVLTVLGGPGRIIWIGRREVACARHPRPETVWPVCVAAGAFGVADDGTPLPARDLYVSPDHALYVDGVLVPAHLLVNGTTIRQEARERVTYHHIELAQHDLVLAEGLPAETYLDTGDRAAFAGGPVMALHPDFTARIWEMQGCAPLVVTGAALQRARQRVAAGQIGQMLPAAARA